MNIKKETVVLLVICILVFSGCNQNKNFETENTGMVEERGDKETATEQQKNEPEKEDAEYPAIEEILETLNQFYSIVTVKYADENHLFIFADKVYLFDLKTNSFLYETEKMRYTELCQAYVTDYGYVIVDTDETDEQNEGVAISCTYYDNTLTREKKVNIKEEFGLEPFSPGSVSVSQDGKKLAVSDFGRGLYICDIEKKTKENILFTGDLNYEARGGLAGLSEISFANNDQKIAFNGQCFSLPIKDGEMGFPVYGSIDVNGDDLSFEKGNEFDKLQVFEDFVILSEKLTFQGASGEAWLYDADTGDTEKIFLKETSESGYVWGSDFGNYIITSVQEKQGWRIRVYSTGNGKLLEEKMYECDEIDAYRDPYIYMNEESHMILLYFRPLGENQQYRIDGFVCEAGEQ